MEGEGHGWEEDVLVPLNQELITIVTLYITTRIISGRGGEGRGGVEEGGRRGWVGGAAT